MQVINYFDSDNKEHWLDEIKRSDWGAGAFLHELLSKNTIFEATGENTRVLLLDEIERLAKAEGISEVYISTNHVGLYEKYGCEFKCVLNDMDGEPSRVYVKPIAQ